LTQERRDRPVERKTILATHRRSIPGRATGAAAIGTFGSNVVAAAVGVAASEWSGRLLRHLVPTMVGVVAAAAGRMVAVTAAEETVVAVADGGKSG
jgi:hypothetical protein